MRGNSSICLIEYFAHSPFIHNIFSTLFWDTLVLSCLYSNSFYWLLLSVNKSIENVLKFWNWVFNGNNRFEVFSVQQMIFRKWPVLYMWTPNNFAKQFLIYNPTSLMHFFFRFFSKTAVKISFTISVRIAFIWIYGAGLVKC